MLMKLRVCPLVVQRCSTLTAFCSRAVNYELGFRRKLPANFDAEMILTDASKSHRMSEAKRHAVLGLHIGNEFRQAVTPGSLNGMKDQSPANTAALAVGPDNGCDFRGIGTQTYKIDNT